MKGDVEPDGMMEMQIWVGASGQRKLQRKWLMDRDLRGECERQKAAEMLAVGWSGMREIHSLGKMNTTKSHKKKSL